VARPVVPFPGSSAPTLERSTCQPVGPIRPALSHPHHVVSTRVLIEVLRLHKRIKLTRSGGCGGSPVSKDTVPTSGGAGIGNFAGKQHSTLRNAHRGRRCWYRNRREPPSRLTAAASHRRPGGSAAEAKNSLKPTRRGRAKNAQGPIQRNHRANGSIWPGPTASARPRPPISPQQNSCQPRCQGTHIINQAAAPRPEGDAIDRHRAQHGRPWLPHSSKGGGSREQQQGEGDKPSHLAPPGFPPPGVGRWMVVEP